VSIDEEGRATETARTQGRGARYNERRKKLLLRRRCRCRRRRRQTCSDCDGIAILRIFTKHCTIWPKSYHNPMQFDLCPTYLGGGPVLTVPSKNTHWVGVQSSQCYLLHEPINPHFGLSCGLTASINPLLALSLC
jgi:hypothetical protein